MKYIIKNPTEEQINALKKLGLCVYCTPEGIHYVDVPDIQEEELPKVDVVDLGLPSGLKWASCNIGANSPCDSGLLFQWGRVDGYAYGSDCGTSFEAKDGLIPTNSNPPTESGKTYVEGEVLDPADDAAYVATNGKLRMPTVEEIDELLANTINQWCQCTVLGEDHTSHNVYGRLFTGPNGNKIFIPGAGYFAGNSSSGSGKFLGGGSFCCVWSSSVHTDMSDTGYGLNFYSSECNRSNNNRYNGLSVRGVCTNTNYVPNVPSEEELSKGVDLGLPSGLKWAKYNVGANEETDPGFYFSWGDTEGHAKDSDYDFFSYNNYKSNGLNAISTNLTLAQDAANVHLGREWRMPTKEEFEELFNNTYVIWTTINGVNGYKFINNTDASKYIFMPAAGFYNSSLDSSSFRSWNDSGDYWSSTFSDDSYAFGLYFSYSNKSTGIGRRCCGSSVRAVYNSSAVDGHVVDKPDLPEIAE